jgi:hypothetical protein
MFEKAVKNLNWSIIGLQTLIVVICMKIAEMAWLDHTSEAILLPSCQIVFAVIILLFTCTKIRESFGSLEIFIGGTIGLLLVNQGFNLLAIGVSLVAIWLLEQNEVRPETVTGKHYLWITVVLLGFAILMWYWFGISSLKWIIILLIGWIFQMACMMNHRVWKTNSAVWYPVQICRSKLWIANFVLANLGILGLALTNLSINLALILVLGKIFQKDRVGRWISITRVIAISLVVLPEIFQNALQFLLQHC